MKLPWKGINEWIEKQQINLDYGLQYCNSLDLCSMERDDETGYYQVLSTISPKFLR